MRDLGHRSLVTRRPALQMVDGDSVLVDPRPREVDDGVRRDEGQTLVRTVRTLASWDEDNERPELCEAHVSSKVGAVVESAHTKIGRGS